MRINILKVRGHGYGSTPINLVNTSEKNDLERNFYTVFLGENGSGKSRILNSLALFYSGKSKNSVELGPEQDKPSRTIVVTHGIGDSYPLDKSFTDNYKDLNYIYLGNKTRNGHYSKNSLLERTLRVLIECADPNRLPDVCKSVFEFIGYLPVIKAEYSIDKKILSIDKGSKYGEIKKKSNLSSERFEEMMKKARSNQSDIIPVTFDFEQKKIVFGKNNVLTVPQIRELLTLGYLKATSITVNTKNRDVSSEAMSSGEVGILSSFLSLIATLKANSLVLIDEPEVSLHPGWQIQYYSMLKLIMNTVQGSHVMIATHSHFLVSDLHPDDSSIIVVKADPSGDINAQAIDYSPYTWSAENILLKVFSVNSSRSYYFSQHVQNALDLLASHERNDEELKSEIEIIKTHSFNLKETDPLYTIVHLLLEPYEK